MDLKLVPPAARYRDSFLRALHAWRREGLRWQLDLDLEAVELDFARFVADKLADARPRGPSVPRTHLWAIANDELVGVVSIRHALTDALRVAGGHIGYDTAPAFRRRGVATEMLRRSLPVACALGLRDVLLTCDDDNLASIRVIEANGGVLRETKQLGASAPAKRYYWIDTRRMPPP